MYEPKSGPFNDFTNLCKISLKSLYGIDQNRSECLKKSLLADRKQSFFKTVHDKLTKRFCGACALTKDVDLVLSNSLSCVISNNNNIVTSLLFQKKKSQMNAP